MNDWPTAPQQALQPAQPAYQPAPVVLQRPGHRGAIMTALTAFALVLGVIALAVAVSGHGTPAAPKPKTVTHTVVKWKTRTVNHTRTVTKTVDVPQPSPGNTVTCYPYGGQAYLSSPGTSVPASSCTLSITPVYPLSSGEVQITVTAPDGDSSTFTATS